jgi:hypothetical protein
MTEDREHNKEPDRGQVLIFAAVAATVLVSVFMGFWLLGLLSGMQR